MKPGELSTWLKSVSRYAKVTRVRLNQDDSRSVALTASAKRFQTVEDIVLRLPDVQVVEALDGNSGIVGAFTVYVPEAPARAPEDIEKTDPQSPAGLMAAYARHIAQAYKDGGKAVADSTKDSVTALTGLVSDVLGRLNALEDARTREMNARAKVLEKMQESSDGGDGLPSMQELFMMSMMQRGGLPPPPPNGSGEKQ